MNILPKNLSPISVNFPGMSLTKKLTRGFCVLGFLRSLSSRIFAVSVATASPESISATAGPIVAAMTSERMG